MKVYCETKESKGAAFAVAQLLESQTGALSVSRWGESLETPRTTSDSFGLGLAMFNVASNQAKVPHVRRASAEDGRTGFVQEQYL